MTKFVALLRAVNVGGTGKLPMKQLVALCGDCGFDNARTYIQSGNVVFDSRRTEAAVQDALAKALTKMMGKLTDLVVRTDAEMRAVLKANPFKDNEGAKVAVAFLSGALPPRARIRSSRPAARTSAPAIARSTSTIRTAWAARNSSCRRNWASLRRAISTRSASWWR